MWRSIQEPYHAVAHRSSAKHEADLAYMGQRQHRAAHCLFYRSAQYKQMLKQC